VEARGDFGRLVTPDWAAMRFMPSELIEELPLRDPVSTDTRAIRFHLLMEIIQFLFQDFGPLIELKLREALCENRLDLIKGVRLQEIQHHRIGDDELAVDGFGLSSQSFGKDAQINIR
jgi:hypothetical protein